MPDGIVDLEETPVLRVKAFRILEGKLPTLEGRKFYGAFNELPDGEEEYYACAVRIETDNPERMQLEAGLIPGGKYARRKIEDWEKVVREGKMPETFNEFARSHMPNLDGNRPSLEYYRSHEELFIFVPVKAEIE